MTPGTGERGPVSAEEFAVRMDRLGPFGPAPHIALAVSGGADSMALALLASAWAVARGGRATALTVDHGLRPDSAAEAARVGAWLAARAIPHAILPWTGPKPAADIENTARIARYRLLEEWCGAEGVLHLVLAHHREDQAETLLLRLGRGSGVHGLAAMAPFEPGRTLCRLRPLLDLPRGRLRDTLAAWGQDWVEDPSNQDGAYARVRLRRLAPVLAAEGLTPARLAATAGRLARARDALERAVAEAALAWVSFYPEGYAELAAAGLAAVPDEVGLRLLAHLLRTVGGAPLPPRLERLEGLYQALRAGLPGARTLAGCRVAPLPGTDRVLICRESARMAAPVPLSPGQTQVWDGRFRVRVAETAPPGLVLGALGRQGWRRILSGSRPEGSVWRRLPAAVRPTLPAISDQECICVVPHLGYNRKSGTPGIVLSIIPSPSVPMTAAGSRLV